MPKRTGAKTTPPPAVPPYTPTVLRKTVVLEQRNGVPIIMGTLDPSIHTMREFITVEHPYFGTIHASLIRVKDRTVWYRQILKEVENGKTAFDARQQ